MIRARLTVMLATLTTAFWLTSCASTPARPKPPVQPKPTWTEEVSTHLPDTEDRTEHDEFQGEDNVSEWYPNRQAAMHVVYCFLPGGMIDATCTVPKEHCELWQLKVTGFKEGFPPRGFYTYIPEGTYTLTVTNNPDVGVIKDEGQLTVGYWANTKNGGFVVVRTYPEAQTVVDWRR